MRVGFEDETLVTFRRPICSVKRCTTCGLSKKKAVTARHSTKAWSLCAIGRKPWILVGSASANLFRRQLIALGCWSPSARFPCCMLLTGHRGREPRLSRRRRMRPYQWCAPMGNFHTNPLKTPQL